MTRRPQVLTRIIRQLDTSNDDGCWTWQGSRLPTGYGVMSVHNRSRNVHRLMWEELFGPIPEGLVVCHKCDNPPCARPEHLFVGTHGDNVADKMRKGRYGTGHIVRGQEVGTSKLTEDEVREIRRLRDEGYSERRVAAVFGISKNHVTGVYRRRHWAHVPPDDTDEIRRLEIKACEAIFTGESDLTVRGEGFGAVARLVDLARAAQAGDEAGE